MAVTKVRKNISLNVGQPNNFELICAMQDDNKAFEITATIYNGNELYEVAGTIRLKGENPVGNSIYKEVDSFTAHTVTFTLTEDMLRYDGLLKLVLVMTGNGTQITTFPFIIKVVNSPGGNNADDIQAISALIEEAQHWADLSKSYSIGTDDEVRDGDSTDNSKYYYEQTRDLIENINFGNGNVIYYELYDDFLDDYNNGKIESETLIVIKESLKIDGSITPIPTYIGDLTYNGMEQTALFKNYNSKKMTVEGNIASSPGNHSAIFTLLENHIWSDETISPKTVIWNIKNIVISSIPSASGTLTYTGNSQSPTWLNYDTDKMEIGGDTAKTSAGNYSAKFTPKYGYEWSDGTTEAKTVTWIIDKAVISIPATSSSFTYNGGTKTPTFTNYDLNKMTLSGDSSGINAGTYTAKFTPKSNYKWSDGTTGIKNVTWTIAKANGTITLSSNSVSFSKSGSQTLTFSNNSGNVTVSSSDESVATATISGNTITINSITSGNATITVNVASSSNYNSTSKTISVLANYSINENNDENVLYLIKDGNECSDVTGGWNIKTWVARGFDGDNYNTSEDYGNHIQKMQDRIRIEYDLDSRREIYDNVQNNSSDYIARDTMLYTNKTLQEIGVNNYNFLYMEARVCETDNFGNAFYGYRFGSNMSGASDFGFRKVDNYANSENFEYKTIGKLNLNGTNLPNDVRFDFGVSCASTQNDYVPNGGTCYIEIYNLWLSKN